MSDLLVSPVTVPGALPVLTEELEAAPAVPAAASVPVPSATPEPALPLPTPAAAVTPADTPAAPPMEASLDAHAIEEEVLAELAQRIDLMFEYRLREALAPTLARAADLLIREAREEVALTLRDVVSRAVAQQIARRRAGR